MKTIDFQPRLNRAAIWLIFLMGTSSLLSQTLFFEDFEGIPLGPNEDESLVGEQVWAKTPPAGWVQDDTGIPGVGDDATDGVTEWAGWSFADKDWWTDAAEDQRRSEFSRGRGTVMIADPDEWDDQSHADSEANGWYETYITTPEIEISGSGANTLVLAFDSSWRPEFDSNYRQSAIITVSYDGGEPIEVLRWLSDSSSPFFKDDNSTNDLILIPLKNPAGANRAKITFGMFDAGNDWWWALDNISVGVPPLVTGIELTPAGFTLSLTDSADVSLVLSSLRLSLDGESISPSNTRTETVNSLNQNIISYHLQSDFFDPGSDHVIGIDFNNSLGDAVSLTQNVTFPDFPVIGMEFAASEGEVDTSAPGFLALVSQSLVDHGNDRELVNRLLSGRLLDCDTGSATVNFADLSTANAEGLFELEGAINMDKDALDLGSFPGDSFIPGIPGTGPIEFNYDRFAIRFATYLQLDRGAYRFGINCDDVTTVSFGSDPRSFQQVELGRGGGEFLFDFAVENPGIYPFQVVWSSRAIQGSLEFFSEDINTGERILINDPDNPSAIKAYRQGSNSSYVAWVNPSAGSVANPGTMISYQLVAGDDSVEETSLTLSLDGASSNANVQNLGNGIYQVSWQPDSVLVSGSRHQAELSYQTGGETVSQSWAFTAANYQTVPAALATATGTGSDPGMKWRTHQLDSSRDTQIAAAESQLAGELGASIHDPEIGIVGPQQTDGFFNITWVNFEQAAGAAGQFSSTAPELSQFVPDSLIPGINIGSNNDNIAGEALAYLEFAQPQVIEMVVNSDDGFQVSVGNRQNPAFIPLGAFDGGRGAADTVFRFYISQEGVYLFRLLWFEGGGGASVEWFTIDENGCRGLVNGEQPGSIMAFRNRTVAEPELPVITDGGIASWTWENEALMINYTGTLKSSMEVDGPYLPVTGATSPYSATPSEAQQYFIAE